MPVGSRKNQPPEPVESSKGAPEEPGKKARSTEEGRRRAKEAVP